MVRPHQFLWLNLVPLACIGGAIYLAARGQDGWGWFLFVAACFAVVPSASGSSNSDD